MGQAQTKSATSWAIIGHLSHVVSTVSPFSFSIRPGHCRRRNHHTISLRFAHNLAVHCRRRKIRCLQAPGDVQKRCENCIRLRKECQFFPVDQQPPVEKKSRPSSRLETAPTGGSVTTPMSSSPTNLNPESVENFYQYPPPISMSVSPGQDMPAFSPSTFGGTPMSGFTPGRSRTFPGFPFRHVRVH